MLELELELEPMEELELEITLLELDNGAELQPCTICAAPMLAN
jgi:hypothetical protein